MGCTYLASLFCLLVSADKANFVFEIELCSSACPICAGPSAGPTYRVTSRAYAFRDLPRRRMQSFWSINLFCIEWSCRIRIQKTVAPRTKTKQKTLFNRSLQCQLQKCWWISYPGKLLYSMFLKEHLYERPRVLYSVFGWYLCLSFTKLRLELIERCAG